MGSTPVTNSRRTDKLALVKYSRPIGSRRRGSRCQRNGSYASEGLFLAVEQDQIWKPSITKDPPGSPFDIRPFEPLRFHGQARGLVLFEFEDRFGDSLLLTGR
jgi:hypothetical protein